MAHPYHSGRLPCCPWLFAHDGFLACSEHESFSVFPHSRWGTFALAPKLQPDIYLSSGEPDARVISQSRLGFSFAESRLRFLSEFWERPWRARRNFSISIYIDRIMAVATRSAHENCRHRMVDSFCRDDNL